MRRNYTPKTNVDTSNPPKGGTGVPPKTWQCSECGTWNPDFHATVNCSQQTPQQKIERLTGLVHTLHNAEKRWKEIAQRRADWATMWQGKYSIVVAENNALRKQVRKLKEPEKT